MIPIIDIKKSFGKAGIVLFLFSQVLLQPAYPEGLFGGKDEVLWESGINLYIKLEGQDKSLGGKTIPNDHPIALETKQITDALTSVEFWEKKGLFKKSEENSVFSISQARLLGNYLSQGLGKAKPDQDIVFALSKIKKGTLGLGNKAFLAGRAFYKDKRLHIILGDYDKPADLGREAAEGGAGVTEVQYFFTTGRRAKPSDFKKIIITGNGVESYTQGNKHRRDWIVIDVPVAAAAYVARTEKKDKAFTADSEALRQEAEKLADERRKMRAEMARMRKEIDETKDYGGEQLSIEERLDRLEELHKKKMITDDEYNKKRQEILNDI